MYGSTAFILKALGRIVVGTCYSCWNNFFLTSATELIRDQYLSDSMNILSDANAYPHKQTIYRGDDFSSTSK